MWVPNKEGVLYDDGTLPPDEQKLVDDDWEHFWKELMCHEDGSLNLEKVKIELYVYHRLMQDASKVYYHVTDGNLSKPNTNPAYIIDFYEDALQKAYDEGHKDGKVDARISQILD